MCFGNTGGNLVRTRLGAYRQIDEFVETNRRGWRNRAFENSEGVVVIIATHPSIADWTAPDYDPSEMVKRVMGIKPKIH